MKRTKKEIKIDTSSSEIQHEEERSKVGSHRLWVGTLDHALYGRSLEDYHILVHTNSHDSGESGPAATSSGWRLGRPRLPLSLGPATTEGLGLGGRRVGGLPRLCGGCNGRSGSHPVVVGSPKIAYRDNTRVSYRLRGYLYKIPHSHKRKSSQHLRPEQHDR